MPPLRINGLLFDGKEGEYLIDTCLRLGIEIPHFCYHTKLSRVGNCRMCFVQVEGSQKLLPSCTTLITEGMTIETHSEVVQKARQDVLEFLLINHPLDCPVCDQGGECDLQDLTYHYGPKASRFSFDKRVVKDENLGPFIETHMTRCIHCSRCVRFSQEIAGTSELAMTSRGEHLEVLTYLKQTITSELSGNLIDICPVGALNHKPSAALFRSWEIQKSDTIDVMDAMGSHISIHHQGSKILRVVPRTCETINETWIHDRTRFSYDGLNLQRLHHPYVRNSEGKLESCSFEHAFKTIASRLRSLPPEDLFAVAGDMVDLETLFLIKALWEKLGSSNIECRIDGTLLSSANRAHYLFNTSFQKLEEVDAVLIIGSHLRIEAPLVNARIRKRWREARIPIALVGQPVDLTYPYEHLGTTLRDLTGIVDHAWVRRHLEKALKPTVLIGLAAYNHPIHDSINKLVERYPLMSESWKGMNVVHTNASAVGALDLGFISPNGFTNLRHKHPRFIYLAGVDHFTRQDLEDAFVVYQGHHGDKGARYADVILPGLAYTEKSGLYVNMEGRAQYTAAIIPPPGEAMEDWKIILHLAKELGCDLGYRNLNDIRAYLLKDLMHLRDSVSFHSPPWTPLPPIAFTDDSAELFNLGTDFYDNDVISRNSPNMAAQRKLIRNKRCPLIF